MTLDSGDQITHIRVRKMQTIPIPPPSIGHLTRSGSQDSTSPPLTHLTAPPPTQFTAPPPTQVTPPPITQVAFTSSSATGMHFNLSN